MLSINTDEEEHIFAITNTGAFLCSMRLRWGNVAKLCPSVPYHRRATATRPDNNKHRHRGVMHRQMPPGRSMRAVAESHVKASRPSRESGRKHFGTALTLGDFSICINCSIAKITVEIEREYSSIYKEGVCNICSSLKTLCDLHACGTSDQASCPSWETISQRLACSCHLGWHAR